jgi:hypothetical protein
MNFQFHLYLQIPRCPDRERWNQQLKIKPEAVNEQLIVDIEIMCECDCENPNSNSPVIFLIIILFYLNGIKIYM